MQWKSKLKSIGVFFFNCYIRNLPSGKQQKPKCCSNTTLANFKHNNTMNNSEEGPAKDTEQKQDGLAQSEASSHRTTGSRELDKLPSDTDVDKRGKFEAYLAYHENEGTSKPAALPDNAGTVAAVQTNSAASTTASLPAAGVSAKPGKQIEQKQLQLLLLEEEEEQEEEQDMILQPVMPLPSPRVPNPQATSPGAYASGGIHGSRRVRLASIDSARFSIALDMNDRLSSGTMSIGTSSVTTEQLSPNVTGAEEGKPGLVEAYPIENDPHIELASPENSLGRRKRTEDSQSSSCLNTSRILAISLAVLVCIGAVLICVFSLGGRFNGKDEKTINDNAVSLANTSITPEVYLKQRLPQETLDAIDNYNSPQSRAFDWLYQDPVLFDYTEQRLRQRFALASLHYSTNGTAWIRDKDWLSYDVHECYWYFAGSMTLFGVDTTADSPCQSLDASNNNNKTNNTDDYKLLWLSRNNVDGPLQNEIYWLTSLESIDFAINNVSGTIASNISDLKSLQQFSFPRNKLSGSLPVDALEALADSLTVLFLADNMMYGTIPSEVGLLRKIEQMTLQSNGFTGSIPSQMGLLENLTIFGLHDTLVSGTVPTEFGQLSSLQYIYAFGNQFTGPIPSEIAKIPQLAWIHLNGNKLTGSIPTEFGRLSAVMKELNLAGNNISSTIPSELNLLTLLDQIDLSNNQLTGTITSLLGQLSQLVTLQLAGNRFSGTLPFELGNLKNLETMNLSQNKLTGSLPLAFGSLSSLEELVLTQNDFTGTLPPAWGSLHSIVALDLSDNDLSGTVPMNYSFWSKLSSFNISFNPKLNGSIPSNLCSTLNASSLGFDCTALLCGCDCPCFV